MNTSTPEDESSQSGPTESDVFAASEPFSTATAAPSGGSFHTDAFAAGSEPFVGVDGFAPGGPLPSFGTDPGASGVVQATCLDVARGLPYFLDDELAPAQAEGVRGHLAGCPPCQSAQAFQMQLRSVVAERAIDPVPDQVRARIISALGLD